jgi:hypothetical protein
VAEDHGIVAHPQVDYVSSVYVGYNPASGSSRVYWIGIEEAEVVADAAGEEVDGVVVEDA